VGPSAIPKRFPAIILGTESHGGNSKEHNYPRPQDYSLYYGVHQRISQPHRKPPGKRPNPTADQPHEQCSHPPPPRPEPNGANESSPRVFKPDRKTIVQNYSAKFGIYWSPSLTHHPRKSLSIASPNPETWQEQRSHPAHMTRPQIRRAPTKQ